VKGTALREEAGKRLAEACTDLNWLEEHARREGYYEFLEQVREMHAYTVLLGAAASAQHIERIERWLDRESYLLASDLWWPQQLPGLFYQQFFNRAVETGAPPANQPPPSCWVKQT